MEKIIKLKKWLVLSTLLMGISGLFAQNALPEKPDSWVNDYAKVLSKTQVQNLETQLQGLESRSSNQIFIALFDRLPEGYDLDDYTNRLFEKWQPGLKDKNNGILVSIFIRNRNIRIEVGYGLEDVVTDAQAYTLINEVLKPYFGKGDYYGGLNSMLKMLIPAAEGKYQIPVHKKPQKKKNPLSRYLVLFILFVIVSRFFRGGGSSGFGTRRRGGVFMAPMIFGGFGGGSSGGSFGGGGFSGGFGGMSGGGGASGGW